jgi:hypothetical protein
LFLGSNSKEPVAICSSQLGPGNREAGIGGDTALKQINGGSAVIGHFAAQEQIVRLGLDLTVARQ